MYKKDYQLTIQRYLSLASVILLLFVLILLSVNIEGFIIKKRALAYEDGHRDLKKMDSLAMEERAKLYREPLIVDGKNLKTKEDLMEIEKAIDLDRPVIFSSLPREKYIKEHKLQELLGIGEIIGQKTQKNLNLVPGFMLGGLHEFEDISYSILEIEPLFSTKIYGFSREKGDKDVPVIWRNIYDESEIYIVNGPFMETDASHGIISAFMSQIHQDYIYPVVNTRFMTYEGLPYISYENKERLEKTYTRDAMKFQHDILFPDTFSINKRRGFILNGYLTLGFENIDIEAIDDFSIRQIRGYKKQIYTDGGEMGIRYSEAMEKHRHIYDKIFENHPIKSISIGEDIEDLEKIIAGWNSLESVVGPFGEGKAFKYLDKKTVYIPRTLNAIEADGQEKFEFISSITAFGAIVQNLKLEDIVIFKGDEELWTSTSKAYMKFIDDYRERFGFLEDRNITQTADAVRLFLNSRPEIHISEDKIEIKSDRWDGQTHYILRTDKEIDSIENGKAELIEEGAYLITIDDKQVDIFISEKNRKLSR